MLALLSLGHQLRASTGVQGQCCGDLGEAGAPRDNPPQLPLVPQGREEFPAGSEPLSLLVVLLGLVASEPGAGGGEAEAGLALGCVCSPEMT